MEDGAIRETIGRRARREGNETMRNDTNKQVPYMIYFFPHTHTLLGPPPLPFSHTSTVYLVWCIDQQGVSEEREEENVAGKKGGEGWDGRMGMRDDHLGSNEGSNLTDGH